MPSRSLLALFDLSFLQRLGGCHFIGLYWLGLAWCVVLAYLLALNIDVGEVLAVGRELFNHHLAQLIGLVLLVFVRDDRVGRLISGQAGMVREHCR